jgi:hypothetical protein
MTTMTDNPTAEFTPAATRHFKGVAPLTMVRIGNPLTTIVSVYEDQIVPVGADPEDVARLVDEGYLVEVELVTEVAVAGLTPEQAAEYADYVQAQHERIEGLEQDLAAARTLIDADDTADKLEAKDAEIATLRTQVEDLSAQLEAATPAPAPAPAQAPAKKAASSSRGGSS